MASGDQQLQEAQTDVELELESKKIKVAGEATDLALRQVVGIVALVLMVFQVFAADAVFVWYGDTRG